MAVAVMTWACQSERVSEDRRESGDKASTLESVDRRPVVLFLGTSLTAGLGVPEEESFAGIIGRKIDSLGAPLRVVNAGESGGTSAGGLRRIDFLLDQYEVAVLVLELGANDGLRGLDIDAMRANLEAIIVNTKTAFPESDLVIAGMEAPPNLGELYTREFRGVFAELADKHAARLIPFLLEGVGAVPQMNQDDGIHPNAEGHALIAQNVWQVLEGLVRERIEVVAPVSGDSQTRCPAEAGHLPCAIAALNRQS
jgi:acyl-CoA thioesterase-1